MRFSMNTERLNIFSRPDWGEYLDYIGIGGMAEYEGWRDERAGLVKLETNRAKWVAPIPVGEPVPPASPMVDLVSEVRFSPDPAATYRYYLRFVWDPTRPVVAFVMLNPSTADAFKTDPTVARVIGFARAMGAGGVVVLNLFALRSTDPMGLRAVADPVGPENDRILREETQGLRTIFAWGTQGAYLGRDRHVIDLLRDRNPECLHLTKTGCPGHPLYLSADRQPTPFPSPKMPQDVAGVPNPSGGGNAPQTKRKPWRRRP